MSFFLFRWKKVASISIFFKISRLNQLISIASFTIWRVLYFRQVADAAAKVLSNGDNIPKILDGVLNLEKDEATAPPSTPTREEDVEKDVST